MKVDRAAAVAPPTSDPSSLEAGRQDSRSLPITKSRLQKSALKFLGYVAVAYLVLKLIPSLESALQAIERVQWQWLLVALVLEMLSEMGFASSWSTIIDQQGVLARDGGSPHTGRRAAWAQLAAGTLVPGGSLGGLGVGAWLLHRFGMPNRVIAERQFNLSFLNTAVDALALIVVGLGMAAGVLPGGQHLTLTLLPAALAAVAIGAALLIAHRSAAPEPHGSARHPKLAVALATLSGAVRDTESLLRTRRSRAVAGALAYLGFDALMLWSAFIALGAHPRPGVPIVVMAYIIGALGGSIPLPASVGSIGGMVGMLILYGVPHNTALAAVLLYQAVGMLVPLVGGGVAYALLRRSLAGLPVSEQSVAEESTG